MTTENPSPWQPATTEENSLIQPIQPAAQTPATDEPTGPSTPAPIQPDKLEADDPAVSWPPSDTQPETEQAAAAPLAPEGQAQPVAQPDPIPDAPATPEPADGNVICPICQHEFAPGASIL